MAGQLELADAKSGRALFRVRPVGGCARWSDRCRGGSLMTPLLILLFGIHPTTAIGTDLLFAASTKTTGTLVHAVARTIDWRLVGLLAIGSVPATIATIVILSHFDLKSDAAQHVITVILGIVLLMTALFLITGKQIRERFGGTLTSLDRRSTAIFTIVLGLTMGVLVTTTSVGSISYLFGISTRQISRFRAP